MAKSIDSTSPTNDYATAAVEYAFVGRRPEIELLTAGLEKLTSGGGHMYLVSGEPGIGKTRLADEIAVQAGSKGIRVAWGRCWEGGGAPAFWPWIQVLRECIRGHEISELVVHLGPCATELAALLPELGPSVQPTTSPIVSLLSDAGPDELAQARFRLFDSASQLLRLIADRTPLLLVLDDCHCADNDSLMMLRFVARELRQKRVMIVVTFRDAEVRQDLRLSELFGLLAREGRGVPLSGLGEDEVRSFVEGTHTARDSVLNAAALLGITEGNPFFLTEVMHLILAERRSGSTAKIAGDQFRIPDSVRAAVRRRVELLSKSAARVLALASVIGRDFDVEIVRQLSRLEEPEFSQAVREALASDLLRADDARVRFRFSHVLFQETLSDDMTESERRALHYRIAQALENSHTGEHTRLAEMAHHYVEALPEGDPAKALEYAVAAARRATDLAAFEEGTRLYTLALRAFELAKDGGKERQCSILLALGQSQLLSGRVEDSKKTFARAGELALELQRPDLRAQAVLGYAAYYSGAGKVDHALIISLEETLADLDRTDSPLRARLLARLAAEHYWADAGERRDHLSREAVEVARRTGDPGTLVIALYAKYLTLWGPETAEERIALSAELVRLADSTSQREMRDYQLRAHFIRVGDLLELGEVEMADAEIETYIRLCGESRMRSSGHPELLRAMRALIDGRLKEAERLALESFALSHENEPSAATNLATQIGVIRREQGRMLEMEPSIRSFIEQSPSLAMARCALALCYSEADRKEDARAHFEHLAKDDFASLPKDATSVVATVFLAEVCAYLGDSDRAILIYRRLRPWVSRNAMLGSQVFYGPVALYVGILCSAMARYEEAEEHFEMSLRTASRVGARPWIARAQCEYAKMLLKRSRPGAVDKAIELSTAAFETASALGLEAIAEKARSLSALGAEIRASMKVDVPLKGAPAETTRRLVATVLFIDIVQSTERAIQFGDERWGEMLTQYYDSIRKELTAFGGREMGNFGDDFLALFDSPGQAVRCACSIRDVIHQLGLEIRAGLHSGECEFSPEGKIGGIALHIGARVVRRAEPGEIVLSNTVRELAFGGGFALSDKGNHTLKGFPGEWRLFAAASSSLKGSFKRNGNTWTVSFKGQTQRLRNTKGLNYVALLLRDPHRKFSHPELFKQVNQTRTNVSKSGQSSAMVDSEKMEASVSRSINVAIANLGARDKSLGAHLTESIKTGNQCSYSPIAEATLSWEL